MFSIQMDVLQFLKLSIEREQRGFGISCGGQDHAVGHREFVLVAELSGCHGDCGVQIQRSRHRFNGRHSAAAWCDDSPGLPQDFRLSCENRRTIH